MTIYYLDVDRGHNLESEMKTLGSKALPLIRCVDLTLHDLTVSYF